MKGLVIKYTHLRSRPGVNAPILAYLDISETVFIKDIVQGDEVDENDDWYVLEGTGFVWSGAIRAEILSELPDTEDFTHYLISYRKTSPYGKPKTDSTDIPERLSFQRLVLPAVYENLDLHDDIDFFVSTLIQDMQKVRNTKKHVILYIPGYQPLPNLSFELWETFVQSYLKHPAQSIAKVIFFSWPSHQLGRKTIDDRALTAGEKFAGNRLYTIFQKLSEQLSAIGKTLNLVVHSFGHQLLNGFLNSGLTFHEGSRVFHRIFLMAPDIVSDAMASPGGITVTNYYVKDRPGQDSLYNFTEINKLAKSIHVFWDKYDYLLHVSTKKFALKIVGTLSEYPEILRYRNLGNYGEKYQHPGIRYYDLQKIAGESTGKDFGFKNLFEKSKWRKKIEAVTEENESYQNVGHILSLLLNSGKFMKHHRYLFTSRGVVEKVVQILNEPDSAPPGPGQVT